MSRAPQPRAYDAVPRLRRRDDVVLDDGQLELLRLLVAGDTLVEAAAEMQISERTARRLLLRARHLAGQRSTIGLAAWAGRHGLI